MAYIATAYIVMTDIVMAYMTTAYIVMACVVKPYIVMAYIVGGHACTIPRPADSGLLNGVCHRLLPRQAEHTYEHTVMAYISMAYIGMA